MRSVATTARKYVPGIFFAKRWVRIAVAGAVAAVFLARVDPSQAAELCDKPVYNPENKSYFELVCPHENEDQRIEWEEAVKYAATRTHNGVRGRLAVVKSREVNDFLRDTFQTAFPTWIGLRLMCNYNRLLWVTGEVYPLTAYSNWASPWNINGETNSTTVGECPRGKYVPFRPVHYWPVDHGFRWNANWPAKEFKRYFVEYPTGKE